MSTAAYHRHPQVRQFVLARGRTRAPSRWPILVHTIVSSVTENPAAAAMSHQEWAVYREAAVPTSVAEISAHSGMALGLVRVIIADLANRRLLEVHAATEHHPRADAVSINILERVLRGLQRLS